MKIELLTLFLMHIVGASIFGRFEVETAWWRLTLKWLLVLGITALLYYYFGHTGSLTFLGTLFITGPAFHFTWCKKIGIHPQYATPQRKYYELRKWKWPEE